MLGGTSKPLISEATPNWSWLVRGSTDGDTINWRINLSSLHIVRLTRPFYRAAGLVLVWYDQGSERDITKPLQQLMSRWSFRTIFIVLIHPGRVRWVYVCVFKHLVRTKKSRVFELPCLSSLCLTATLEFYAQHTSERSLSGGRWRTGEHWLTSVGPSGLRDWKQQPFQKFQM